MLRHLSILVFFAFGFIHLAKCQVPLPDNCPEVKIVETFDLDRYMGKWFEYAKYPFVFEAAQKCQQAVYTNLGDGTVSVVNTGVYYIINKAHSIRGTAKVLAPGQLAVTFRNQTIEKANYLILGTDYNNWVIVFSCTNLTSYAHTENLWILTRERQPSEQTIAAAKQVIKKNNLSETFLIKSVQTGCPKITDSVDNDDNLTEGSSSVPLSEEQNNFDFSAASTERVIETA